MFEVGSGTEHGKPNDADLQPGKGKKNGKNKGKAEPAKKNSGAGVPGRKDASGQEANIEVSQLKKRAKELEALYKKKKDANDAWNIGVKAVAEASGLMSSVVAKVVKARADAKFAAKQREYEQLSLVFAELGE